VPNNLDSIPTLVPFSSTIHWCYRKHSSNHQCTSLCWSSGGILSNSWVGISD
jgi:hypothetical protein